MMQSGRRAGGRDPGHNGEVFVSPSLLVQILLLVRQQQATVRPEDARRIELNLLGKTDVAGGESRRNENIQFNLVDNNALKELNIRLGATTTIVDVFRPERGYFSSEFGNAPGAVLHVPAANRSGIHGSLFW